MELNAEQRVIIEHAIKNRVYCGDSPDMDILCKAGLMEFLGQKSFVPEGYYKATRKGIEAVS